MVTPIPPSTRSVERGEQLSVARAVGTPCGNLYVVVVGKGSILIHAAHCTKFVKKYAGKPHTKAIEGTNEPSSRFMQVTA
jgi:hypothetical protein